MYLESLLFIVQVAKNIMAYGQRIGLMQALNGDFDGNMESPTFSPSLLIQIDRWTPPVTSENIEEWRLNPWDQKPVKHICHTFIRAGKIQFLADCTHRLAGQTVDMVDEE